MTLLSLLSSLLVAMSGPAHPLPPPTGLPGLWGVTEVFGPDARGALVIDGRGAAWTASIAGFTVPLDHASGTVRFTLPEDQGTFRGEVSSDSSRITGQWIQPPGVILGAAYATPVVLRRTGPGVWRGEVEPLPDEITLYLLIEQGDDGSLSASFRNPDFNFGRDNPYAVTRAGSALTLSSTRNSHDTFQATWDSAGDVLRLRVPMIGRTLNLTRRTRNSATGFYPRTPDSAGYTYRVPISTGDGWSTGSLAQAGLDSAPVDDLVEHILQTHYQGFHTPYIHSLLIARHGRLVLEEYFYGHDREDPHDMRSASKTFAGVLVGLALEHGGKFRLDTPVYRLFPGYDSIAHLDDRKKAMTVRDLLTMTSGLACDDNNDDSPGNENTMQGQQDQPDWYRYTLDLPMQATPGADSAVYCSAGINLLGGVLRNSAHLQLPEFFYRYIAQPLEMRRYHINLMPTGPAYLGGGIRMRPRDQLKLGQVYLDGGRWHGQQVIPADWVRQSLKAYSAFAPDHHYGFAWHLVDLQSGGRTWQTWEAGGNGGQFVLIIPALDMVVGFTAGNYGDYRTWYKFMTDLVPRYVIPAAREWEGR